MKKIIALSLSIIMILALSACGKDKEKDEEKEAEKIENLDFPAKVGGAKISEKPKSVVSLSPALTEIIFDLGYGEQLDGVSDFCDYPEQAYDLDKMGTSSVINFDEIEDVSPELLFTSSKINENDIAKLEQMDISVVYLPLATDIDELWELYDNIGVAFEGSETGLKNAQEKYSEKYNAIKNASKSVAKLIEDGTDEIDAAYIAVPKLNMATGDSLVSSLLEFVGIENIADDYSNWEYPEDEFEDFDPDLIIYQDDIEKSDISSNYPATPAVKNGFLYTVDPEIFEHQGFRMLDEILGIVEYAYPDASLTSDSDDEEQDDAQEEPEEDLDEE